MFISSFKDPETGAWTLDNFLRFFSRKYYYQALVNSFSVTICVTILAIIIGTPMAYFMSVYKIKGKTFLEILIIISMMSPAFIDAYSWILLLGRSRAVTKFFAGRIWNFNSYNIWFRRNIISIYFEIIPIYIHVCFRCFK
ncbi:hypothetical protein R4J09_04645 [Brachyspira intermedia]|uniref:hypothetical protein n=1 Tax=Brachyspira intermedia TaxID=84377 RepID=UPI003007BD16